MPAHRQTVLHTACEVTCHWDWGWINPLLILWRQEVSDKKLTSSLVTLMKKVAKNLGLIVSWEDLKTGILNLDFMDKL